MFLNSFRLLCRAFFETTAGGPPLPTAEPFLGTAPLPVGLATQVLLARPVPLSPFSCVEDFCVSPLPACNFRTV